MNFIINKEEFQSLTAAWTKIANRNSSDHILYNALRGHDLKRGFSPVTSPNKLANGTPEWEGFTTAKNNAKWYIRPMQTHPNPAFTASRALEYNNRIDGLNKKFGITFTPELLEKLRGLL